MANLIRWNPLRDLISLDWDFDQFFREFMEPLEMTEEGYCASPRWRASGITVASS